MLNADPTIPVSLSYCHFIDKLYRHNNDTRADLKQSKVVRPNSLHADENSWWGNQFVRVTNVIRTWIVLNFNWMRYGTCEHDEWVFTRDLITSIWSDYAICLVLPIKYAYLDLSDLTLSLTPMHSSIYLPTVSNWKLLIGRWQSNIHRAATANQSNEAFIANTPLQSRTGLATLTGVMCSTSQCELR